MSVGINKVLCLSGDQPDKNGPAVVNEFNGNGLIELCKVIAEGTLSDGTAIKNPLPIYPGAADDLYTQISKPDALDKLVAKISKGAGFVQTQYCFDYESVLQYVADDYSNMCLPYHIQKNIYNDTFSHLFFQGLGA